jgi:hypothetical protein
MKKYFAILALALCCYGCFETKAPDNEFTGTSTTSGNPTKIDLGFVDSTGPTNVTGTIGIYAKTQIPMPEFEPEPLLKFEIKGKRSFILNSSDLSLIADSLWPASSRIGDSIYQFNILVTNDSLGTIMEGFSYNANRSRFNISDSVDHKEKSDSITSVSAHLATLVDIPFLMREDFLEPEKEDYAFIPGTKYFVHLENTHPILRKVPRERHTAAFILLWQKNHGPSGSTDSTIVYRSNSQLDPENLDSLFVAEGIYSVKTPSEFGP